MKVNVSFQFDSPEEAVQFLGRKVLGVPPEPAMPKQIEAPRPTEKRGRGRPPKKAEAPEKAGASQGDRGTGTTGSTPTPPPTASVPQPAVPAKSPAAEPSQAAQAPTAAVPSDADVTAALQSVLKATGMNKVTAIFARYGVQRGREVKGEDRAGFMADCAKVASKEIDPEKGEANPE
jgi:hypothetical protein